MVEASGPNAKEIAYWNGANGRKWVRFQESMDRMLQPLSRQAMEVAGIVEGQSVLDVGCGCGGTSLDLARRVGSDGSVTGIDISTEMLARAVARAAAEPDLPLRFLNADASVETWAEPRDHAFSRMGVMFFRDPVASFANIRSALKPGGRFTFVCWGNRARNPWRSIPMAVAERHIELPAPAPPDEPGPFAFADGDRPRQILTDAGFAEVRVEVLECDLLLGDTVEGAAEHAVQLGPLGNILREAPEDVQARVADEMCEAMTPHLQSDGFRLGASCWLATAVAP
jgi:SAM-dependent methyltransferase